MKIIDFALDLETLAKEPDAAIIEIACKRFYLGESADRIAVTSDVVNATSCILYGMRVSEDTVSWWKEKPMEERERLMQTGIGIKDALLVLGKFILTEIAESEATGVRIWCEGTDFDIAIIRNAYRTVFGNETKIPWKYNEVRDARTFIWEGMRILEPGVENPFEAIPPMENWRKHEALSDCENLAHNVQYVWKRLNDKIRGV